MKEIHEITEILNNQFGDGAVSLEQGESGKPWLLTDADKLVDIAKYLRDDPEMQFNTLMCLSGIHYPKEEELAVAYHLHSTILRHSLALKVKVPESGGIVPSVEKIWKTANWHEREAMDMVGVWFDNHPNMKRILTPDDWEGHPLRKDYVQQELYQGMPTGE
jgi:NADH-quinone oxidoreductase subunit C